MGGAGHCANLLTFAAEAAVATSLPAPPRNRPHYVLWARVEPGLMAADGTLTVSFAPSVATDRLVFRLWPNSPFYSKRGASLTVSTVRSAGHRLPTARPDPTTLVVRRALAGGERITVSMKVNKHFYFDDCRRR